MTPEQKANEFRDYLGLGRAPIHDLPALIEAGTTADVMVMHMPDGLDGMTRCNPDTGAVIIAVASSDNPERQRFSLAHELGHIVFDDFTADASELHAKGPAETRAHDFARHLLAPLAGVQHLVNAVPAARAEELVADTVQHFGISAEPAAIQLHAIDAISAEEKEDLSSMRSRALATRYGWSAERDARVADALRSQPPQQIIAAATRAYADGKLSLRMLARLRGEQSFSSLKEELDGAGIVPDTLPVERVTIDVDDW